jgi:hypothetical protein
VTEVESQGKDPGKTFVIMQFAASSEDRRRSVVEPRIA